MKRMHIERHPPENSRKYEYQIYNVDRYSMMITNSAIFHVQYLDLYQSTLPVEFRNFVDKNMNCEDLFFNAVVAKYLNDRFGYTACPCQAVDGANKLKKLEKKLPGNHYMCSMLIIIVVITTWNLSIVATLETTKSGCYIER